MFTTCGSCLLGREILAKVNNIIKSIHLLDVNRIDGVMVSVLA